MQGIAPHMNGLFWGQRDFQMNFSILIMGQGYARNVWIHLLGSSMVDIWILSNNMKSPCP